MAVACAAIFDKCNLTNKLKFDSIQYCCCVNFSPRSLVNPNKGVVLLLEGFHCSQQVTGLH